MKAREEEYDQIRAGDKHFRKIYRRWESTESSQTG